MTNLNHAQRRALRLLGRGDATAYLGLPDAVRRRLEAAGLTEPGTPTTLEKAAAMSTEGDASVMVERSGGRSPTAGSDR